MFRMPGTSFSGTVPAPSPELAPLRAQLESDVRALAETIGHRNVFDAAKTEAAVQHVERRFASLGLASRRETFAAQGQMVSNVIAEVPGGAAREEIVVLGAHYDTVVGTPGANDNATGVAAVLALAERFAAACPARTLRFVAFATEEPPCFQTEEMGSLVHARGCAARGEKVVAMLALETLGCFRDEEGSQQYPAPGMTFLYPSRGDFVSFVSDLGARGLVHETIGAFRERAKVPSEGAAMPMWVPGIGWSDHWSFRQAGFPAVMVTDTAVYRDGAYHAEGDVPERVDFHRLSLVVEGLVGVVEGLAAGR
jgi:Zn-dependent M28 family amino/carboxypeptidase